MNPNGELVRLIVWNNPVRLSIKLQRTKAPKERGYTIGIFKINKNSSHNKYLNTKRQQAISIWIYLSQRVISLSWWFCLQASCLWQQRLLPRLRLLLNTFLGVHVPIFLSKDRTLILRTALQGLVTYLPSVAVPTPDRLLFCLRLHLILPTVHWSLVKSLTKARVLLSYNSASTWLIIDPIRILTPFFLKLFPIWVSPRILL